MKIAKIIYFSALPLLLALIMAFSFVHVFNGGSKGRASESFVSAAQRYAQTIYDARNNNLDEVALSQNDSQYVSSALDTILGTSSAGIGIRAATSSSFKTVYDEDSDDLLYTIPRVVFNKDSSAIVTNRFSYEYTISPQKQIEYQKANGTADNLEVAVARKVKNTVVIVPGQKTKDGLNGDAILFTVHMDSPKSTASGVDATSMGVAIAQILDLFTYENAASNAEKKAKYDNDIVFLFTDARYDSSFGAHAFFDQFYGFYQTLNGTTYDDPEVKDLVSRIKLAINFDSLGTSGASMLLQTSDNNSAIVREFARAMGGTVSSSFVSGLYDSYASDFAAFGDLNALNLVTFGNKGAYAGANDNIAAVSQSDCKKKAELVIGSVEHFGSFDLSKLDSDSNSVYYSFLGIFTVAYAEWVSYIFGVLILLLLGGVVALNIIKKRFSFNKLIRAAIVQLVCLAATVGAMFLIYFLMGVILSGLGLFTIQSLTSYVYANAGILTGYILLAAVLLSLFYTLLRKALSKQAPLTALNLVRGGVVLYSAIAAIISFASPSLACMFAIPAMLFLGTMLATMLTTKYDLNRLYIYLAPLALSLAFALPATTLLALTVRSVLMPIVLLPILMLLLVPSPYILMLIRPLNALVKRLPMRTIRVQKVVTETVADPAKPDKLTQITVKKIFKEKIEWRYRHGVGTAVVAVASVIIIMACSAFSVPFGANVYVNPAAYQPFNQYTSSIYDNSLLLKWAGSGVSSEVPNVQLEIHDKSAFKYFNYALNGYSWDASVNAYVKPLTTTIMSQPAVSTNADRLSITPASFQGQRGVVEIHFPDVSTVSRVTVYDNGTVKARVSTLSSDSLTLRFPLDNAAFNMIDIDFEFKSTRPSELDITYSQYIWDFLSGNNLINGAGVIKESTISEDVRSILDYFKGNDEVRSATRFGVVYTLNETISF